MKNGARALGLHGRPSSPTILGGTTLLPGLARAASVESPVKREE